MGRKSIAWAAFWMAGWLSGTLLMTVGARELTSGLPVFVVLQLRNTAAVLMLAPFIVWQGLSVLKTQRFGSHVVRNVVHYMGQYGWFYAISLIPLARVISIEFTMPIWTAILAAMFLGERLSGTRLAAIALGFIGILVIARPGIDVVGAGETAALFAALMFAVSATLIKSLTRTDSAMTIVAYMFGIQTVLGFLPAYWVWEWPSLELWPWVAVVGVAGTLSHYCFTRALAAADATVVVPMDFLRVPSTALVGWLLYREGVDIYLALGAALILAGNFLNLRREGPPPNRPVKGSPG